MPALSAELTEQMERLAPCDRDAVRLVVCNGLSYQEAAASLGVPISTVNNWKYRGLQKLKDMQNSEHAA